MLIPSRLAAVGVLLVVAAAIWPQHLQHLPSPLHALRSLGGAGGQQRGAATSAASSSAATGAAAATAAATAVAAMPGPTVAVVGSGLAGLAAAHELSGALAASLPEARVVLFEKNGMLGGNSMKASSGINGVNPAAGDSERLFAGDTLSSGGGLCKGSMVEQFVVGCAAGAALLGLRCWGRADGVALLGV